MNKEVGMLLPKKELIQVEKGKVIIIMCMFCHNILCTHYVAEAIFSEMYYVHYFENVTQELAYSVNTLLHVWFAPVLLTKRSSM